MTFILALLVAVTVGVGDLMLMVMAMVVCWGDECCRMLIVPVPRPQSVASLGQRHNLHQP